MAVGERIRELRQGKGITLEQLAAEMAMSHPTISKMERGLAKIDADALPRFAQALRCHPCDFYEERPVRLPLTNQQRVDALERQATGMLARDLDSALDDLLRIADRIRDARERSA